MKNARKFLLKALVSEKEIYTAMFSNCVPRKICKCAASLFKVFYIYTNFHSKLRKCCHEVMVDNCYKSGGRVALQVTAREVMTFW